MLKQIKVYEENSHISGSMFRRYLHDLIICVGVPVVDVGNSTTPTVNDAG